MSRLRMAIIAAAVAGLLVGLGALLRPAEDAPPPVSSAPPPEVARLAEEVERLKRRLEQEAGMRAQLAADIARIEDLLDKLPEPSDGEEPSAGFPPEKPAGARVSGRLDASGGTRSQREQTLVAAGFHPRDVEALLDQLDEVELQRLYLRDRAAREGWKGKGQEVRERRKLDQAWSDAREEFGDDLYDWALYTRGRPNRVRVTTVLAGSPAETAGIQVGDVVERYDGRRILNVRDLPGLTTAGSAGALTSMDVERGGETLRFYVPRGPLGVHIAPILQQPSLVR
ncbi:MAG: PDZ domain-containing protein [Myxococcota bacterium]